MKLGISTACFFPMMTELSPDLIAQLGFDKIEVFFNAEQELNLTYCSALAKKCTRKGIAVHSVHPHCSGYDSVLLFSPYDRRMGEGLALYRRIAKAARRLGAKVITFHGASRFFTKVDIDQYCNVLSQLCAVCAEQGVMLAQENVSWCKSADPDFLYELAQRISPDQLGFVLDVKQAVRAGVAVSRYLEAMGDRICTVHLSDHDDTRPCLVPGEGEMDYPSFFQALRQKTGAPVLIELYRSNYQTPGDLAKAARQVSPLLEQFE